MPVFTDRLIQGLKPGSVIYEERDLACPGLLVRVGKRGDKVWEVVVNRDGRRKRQRLGTYPEVSLAMARRMATERKATRATVVAGLRVSDLWERYSEEMRPRRRSFQDVEKVWQKWGEPNLGRVRLEDLGLLHGADLISEVIKKSSPNRARKVIRYLNPMLKFAAGRGMIAGNPWAGLSVPEGVPARERVLSSEEWMTLWDWSQSQSYPWGPWLSFLMLSAQRLTEVAEIEWGQISDGIWRIPSSSHKSKQQHEVPLSGALTNILDALPCHEVFAFSIRAGKPVAPGSTLKRRIDRDTGLRDWRFHDIRRTASTYMADHGVQRFTVERVIGHTDSSVTAIYDRSKHRAEKLTALEILARSVR